VTPYVDMYKRFHLNKHYFNTVRIGLSVFSLILYFKYLVIFLNKDSIGLVPNELANNLILSSRYVFILQSPPQLDLSDLTTLAFTTRYASITYLINNNNYSDIDGVAF